MKTDGNSARMSQQTPAVKQMLTVLGGKRPQKYSASVPARSSRRKTSGRRKAKRKAASSTGKKRRATSRKSSRSKLTKGSAAAKKRMAQLRAMRKK